MLDWLCTRMEKQQTTGVPARNFAAHSASPSAVFAPATTRIGTMGGKTGAVSNTESFPQITDFLLTAIVSISRELTLCAECERYNSRFKASGQERLWVRNGNSAANLNTLAHISALAVALAAVLSGSHSYRASKSFRRSA